MKNLKEQLLTNPHVAAWHLVRRKARDNIWRQVKGPLHQRVTVQLVYQIIETLENRNSK